MVDGDASTPGVVAEHDTWISIDPVRGCPASCDYCYLGAMGLRTTKPVERVSVGVALDQLAQHLRGRSDRTPVAIGNYTDMVMTPSNRKYLVEFASRFRDRHPDRPLVVITKSPRIVDVLDELDRLEHPVLVFLSHSFSATTGKALESGPVASTEDFYASIREIAQTDHLRAVHFWRPFLHSLNPPELLGQRVAELRTAGAAASVVVGFKSSAPGRQWWSPATRRSLRAEDLPRPGSEYFDESGWAELVRAAELVGYPVYRNTSCAIAKILETPDALRTFEGPEVGPKCHQTSCPQSQRGICAALASDGVGHDRLGRAFTALPAGSNDGGWSLDGGHLTIRGELSESEANTASHISGLRVRPTHVRAEKAWVNFDLVDETAVALA